jgi:SAM-dependent methyltransferase
MTASDKSSQEQPTLAQPTQAQPVSERAAHWQEVYRSKSEAEVSWFEESPQLSLALMAAAGFGPTRLDAAVIDIGGGASRLVDALLARGLADVSVLDLSAAALDRAKERLLADPLLATRAARVSWIAADVTSWRPDRRYDLWHDRAAFHFLTTPAEQQAYVAALRQALVIGGVAIIGTFAPDGPEKCSGLPVMRHDAESLSRCLGAGFQMIATRRHDHQTPWGAVQHFQFTTFRRSA